MEPPSEAQSVKFLRNNAPLMARIKKMMQADDDVGKVARASPVLISKALDIFLQSLIKQSVAVAEQRGAKTLTSSHLKTEIQKDPLFDFCKALVEGVPDLQPEKPRAEPTSPKAKRGRAAVDGAAKTPGTRKPKAPRKARVKKDPAAVTAANGKDASETPTSEPSDEKDADVKREHSDEGTPVMQASNTKNSNEDDKGAADAPPVKAEPGTEPTIKKESGEDARASEEHGGGGDGVGVSCPDIGKKDSNTVDGEGPPAAETDASARAPEISSQETGTAAEDATPPSTAEPSEPAGAAGEGDASEAGTTTTLRETLDISAPLSGTTAPAAETPVEGALEESAPPPATPQDPLTDEPPALESEVWTAPPALADPEDDDYDDLDG